jgi:elongation factor P
MALSFTDLKKGTVFKLNGVPYSVVEYTHKVMGRGGATVSIRARNLLDSKLQSISFKGSEQIEKAELARVELQYLYADSQAAYFMDSKTYEQFGISANNIAAKKNYLKEGDGLNGLIFEGHLVNIELPKNIALKVSQAEEAVRGDTSTAVTKNAVLETGLSVKVPSFVKAGDIINVDTTTGAYRERVKN